MTLTQAIHAAAAGHTIVSNAGKRYEPADLAPIWRGINAASFRTCGMTEGERKGAWSIV